MSNEVTISDDQDISSNAAMVMTKEIEAQITVALKFPRNMKIVEEETKSLCANIRFANDATYSLPRGNKPVRGPSVHFAKGMALIYGNIHHGHKVERKGIDFTAGFTYAWDLQRNVNIKKDFYVKHERKANGAIKKVTDPAEITELVNAQISRSVRNCLLEVMPAHLLDEAQDLCEGTVKAEARKTPIEKRRELAREAFRPYGVDDEKLKKKTGKIFSELTDEELFEIGRALNAIKDKFLTVARWLGEETEASEQNASILNEELGKKEDPKKEEKPKPEAEPLNEKNMMNDYNNLVGSIKGKK